ncbi:flagellar protein FlaG [Marinobacter gudaonensis]|uniref:Flagellar protein FlaG n=1 Tax=Marinobacter gudaonensis TaxID=375760 RepID=A0A1I6GIU9_9GAMM|nr:flagellar protein FlaG [Marinobacter gudaonensis]SFR42090.1 flagellar protein FlaG [Marinobacter gudaonensis]
MNGVNLNSPDLKLVRTSEQAPARASVSPRADGRNASAQEALSSGTAIAGVAQPPPAQVDQAQAKEKSRVIDPEEVGRAVSQLNDFVQNVQRDLQFEVDQELGRTIVRVVDQETQKVIRQIPDEVALRLAENLQQDEPLTLFDLKV